MKRKIISGIMVTVFLVTMVTFAIPVRVSAEFTGDPIVIGLIGPMGWIQWDGIKEGFQLSQDLINNPGDYGLPGPRGIVDKDGKTHELKMVEIDEHGVPVPDPTAGVTELLSALENNPTMQFLMGGFQEGCVLPMREAAMDYAAQYGRPIWDICGTSLDQAIDDGPDSDNPYDDVREDYERYKYMFRSDPMNATWLGNMLFYMMAQFPVPKLSAIFDTWGELPTYVVAEDLQWAETILGVLDAEQAALGLDILGVARPSAIETDFGPIFDAIEASGAKLIIHIFSTVAGATFIRQWGEREIPAVPIGINVETQMQEFYASIDGKCEYETFLSAIGTKSNVNPDAKPLNTIEFWEVYSDKFGHAPIYTAWGGYLFPLLLNATADEWIGKSCDEIIPILEVIDEETLLGRFKYTGFHDLFCDAFSLTPIWPYAQWPTVTTGLHTIRANIPQWYDGKMHIIWPRGYAPALDSGAPDHLEDPTPLPYASKWRIPTSVYCLAETDFAGGPPLPSPPVESDGTPAGFFGYFPLPDGEVGSDDMNAVTGAWQKTCPWNVLEADMDGNQFIDIDDVARVALDWGKTIATC